MRLLAIGLVFLLTAGCGESKPPERNVFDAQTNALKKARSIGQQLDQAAQEQRERIEGEAGSEK